MARRCRPTKASRSCTFAKGHRSPATSPAMDFLTAPGIWRSRRPSFSPRSKAPRSGRGCSSAAKAGEGFCKASKSPPSRPLRGLIHLFPPTQLRCAVGERKKDRERMLGCWPITSMRDGVVAADDRALGICSTDSTVSGASLPDRPAPITLAIAAARCRSPGDERTRQCGIGEARVDAAHAVAELMQPGRRNSGVRHAAIQRIVIGEACADAGAQRFLNCPSRPPAQPHRRAPAKPSVITRAYCRPISGVTTQPLTRRSVPTVPRIA